jgi:hypothetical protein
VCGLSVWLPSLNAPGSRWARGCARLTRSALSLSGNEVQKRIETLATLRDLALEIGISYKTVLRIRDIIERSAKRYKGHKTGFGAWPRSFMKSRAPRLRGYQKKRDALLAAGKHPSQHTIKATGVLLRYAPKHGAIEAALNGTECLLRLLLAMPKVV